MNGMIDFSIGLTEGVAWPWPIAVYLFLAGISGGALGVVLTMRKLMGETQVTPLLKAASVVSFVMIVLGMVCLVLDLTNPLFFWRILVYYNPTSVMSIGVMMLLVYIPTTALLTVMTLKDTLGKLPGVGGLLTQIAQICERFQAPLTWVGLVFAFGICAYTGFLISALVRFPLINTAVLPALFVASGVSAGTAAVKLIAVACFGEKRDTHAMHLLHKAEWPMMAAEVACLLMIFVSLLTGQAGAQAASSAFTTGLWATVFWVGAVAVGFGVPLAAGLLVRRDSAPVFWVTALAGIAGMMCLRLFILYAGQLNSLMAVTI